MFHLSFDDGAEKHYGIGNPKPGDSNINGPFQLSVFFGAGVPQRQCDGCSDDNGLPTPEGKCSQTIRKQSLPVLFFVLRNKM